MRCVRVSSIMRANECAAGWANTVFSLIDPGARCPTFDKSVVHKIFRMKDTDVSTDMWAPQFHDIAYIFACGLDGNVLVHCEGGISRSTAVGIGLTVMSGVSLADAVLFVHAQSPNCNPNKLILSHIDRIFAAGGKFFESVCGEVARLPKDLTLWCDQCRTHFIDGQNCPGKHWL